VAAVLQAALLGVENGYDLQPIETGDGFVETDATIGAATTLKLAIADLAADTVLASAVGAGLVDNHVFMKEAEVEKTEGLDPEALRDFYVYYM
jgi:glutamine synthetase